MASGLISPTLIPGWPAPAPGVREQLDCALAAAGFQTSILAPEGLYVGDATDAIAFLNSYIGSAAQLAWNKTNPQGTGVLDQLATFYASKFAAGRSYSGKVYQIDPASQANIAAMATRALGVLNNAAGTAPWPDGFFWIAADNSQVPMTAQQMYDFAQDVGGYVSGLIVANFALKQAIGAAASMSALQAIDIMAGWPVNG